MPAVLFSPHSHDYPLCSVFPRSGTIRISRIEQQCPFTENSHLSRLCGELEVGMTLFANVWWFRSVSFFHET